MDFTQQQTMMLAFVSLAVPGILLILIGIVIRFITAHKIKKCTIKTTGKVTNYYYKGEMRVGPAVEFIDDNGLPHRTRKKFEGYKQHVRYPNGVSSIYEDDKGWLHTSRGAVGRWYECVSEKWPIGSEMDVFYDPEKPDTNYVDRPVYNRVTSVSLVLTGILFIILSVMMCYITIK